jgi:hypothetical protein
MNNDKTREATDKGCDAWTPIWSVARDKLPAKTKIISLSATGLPGTAEVVVTWPRLMPSDTNPHGRSSGR